MSVILVIRFAAYQVTTTSQELVDPSELKCTTVVCERRSHVVRVRAQLDYMCNMVTSLTTKYTAGRDASFY